MVGVPPQEYWGSLIDPATKRPSSRLEQLLQCIATSIVKQLEPREHHVLTPVKLAAWYHAVGGDYDSLFLQTPSASLSFIYTSLGCFHSLQPSEDPYSPPSIPALTTAGFVHWQTIQLLLDPDEHSVYIQNTLRCFDVHNKADGGVYPCDLPREAFPAIPDAGMVRWHDETLDRLRRDAEAEAAARSEAPRPRMAKQYTGTPPDDESEASVDEMEPAAAARAADTGTGQGYFSVGRWKDKVFSRWDNGKPSSRPASRDSRDPRDRRRTWCRDDQINSGFRHGSGRRPDMSGVDIGSRSSRRRSHPAHRHNGGDYEDDDDRNGNSALRQPRMRTSVYDAPPSPPNPANTARTRHYRHTGSRSSGRSSDRDRDRAPHGPSPVRRSRTPTPPEVQAPTPPPPQASAAQAQQRMPRPSAGNYGRRHSAHLPYPSLSPNVDEDDGLSRVRSRSHDRSSHGSSLSPSMAYDRPTGSYIPTADVAAQGVAATAPPAFARGNLRHTVHSHGRASPYRERDIDKERGRTRDDANMPPTYADDSRMTGVRYVPAERSRRP